MARYTGPRTRLSRRFGVSLFGPSKAFERRNFPPGQHGVRAGRKKKSEYSVALGEKQKLRFQYGILEKQFRGYYEEAARRRGVTGEILLQLLETRLDNVVFRAGFANSRQAARQIVNHGHILVNGHTVDIPSFQVKPGDVIKVGQRPSSQQLATRMTDLTQAAPSVDWLDVNKDSLEVTISRMPERSDIDPLVNEQLIVELYSR
jgi:small subunit ribosomal protein S4